MSGLTGVSSDISSTRSGSDSASCSDSEDKKSIVLPLIDGCPTERSEGFFTNMSGLTDVSSNVSSTRCGSASDSGSNNKNDDKNGSSSQFSANRPCSCDKAPQKEPHPSPAKHHHGSAQQLKNSARTRIPKPFHSPIPIPASLAPS
jgi:hypothetical protein